jgi:short subunit dehydrogenase-like uncharacterized protein
LGSRTSRLRTPQPLRSASSNSDAAASTKGGASASFNGDASASSKGGASASFNGDASASTKGDAAASTPRASRPFDLVLWGATGFTGQLVAEYLTSSYGVDKTLRWALGGRNREKLEKVRAVLAAIDPRASELPIVIGDSDDRASLDAIVRKARVVVSTVGPYTIHGPELVAACVDAGTDYCDLTGESPFIRDMIDRHHARAQQTGARIVHSCGYDSIPSDLGTLVAQETMKKRHGAPCGEVRCFAGESKGGVSGGTVASMLHLADLATHDARIRRILADPYSLDPGRTERGPDRGDQLGVRFDPDLGRWTGPFMMAGINTRIVRRTNALLGYAYGRTFRYRESMSFREGPRGLAGALATSFGTAGALGLMALSPARKLLARALPSPGEGPSKAARERGYFVTRVLGIGEARNGSRAKVLVTVKGKGDPGYGATSRMLSESAVCLALDGDAIASGGGVLTPAACMGLRLVERLARVGITFDATDAS